MARAHATTQDGPTSKVSIPRATAIVVVAMSVLLLALSPGIGLAVSDPGPVHAAIQESVAPLQVSSGSSCSYTELVPEIEARAGEAVLMPLVWFDLPLQPEVASKFETAAADCDPTGNDVDAVM